MNKDSRQMSIEREQTWVSFLFENQGQLLHFKSSVTMHKYTHSNVVPEHIGDFSCLSLCNKPPVVSVELLWANLCIKDDHRTFGVWCWVLVVPLEQKWLWPEREQWRMPQCESQHCLTQCKMHIFTLFNHFFTEYIRQVIPTYFTKPGSTWCTLIKALRKMNIWKGNKWLRAVLNLIWS